MRFLLILGGCLVGVGAEVVVNHLLLGLLGMEITAPFPHVLLMVAFGVAGGVIATRR